MTHTLYIPHLVSSHPLTFYMNKVWSSPYLDEKHWSHVSRVVTCGRSLLGKVSALTAQPWTAFRTSILRLLLALFSPQGERRYRVDLVWNPAWPSSRGWFGPFLHLWDAGESVCHVEWPQVLGRCLPAAATYPRALNTAALCTSPSALGPPSSPKLPGCPFTRPVPSWVCPQVSAWPCGGLWWGRSVSPMCKQVEHCYLAAWQGSWAGAGPNLPHSRGGGSGFRGNQAQLELSGTWSSVRVCSLTAMKRTSLRRVEQTRAIGAPGARGVEHRASPGASSGS